MRVPKSGQQSPVPPSAYFSSARPAINFASRAGRRWLLLLGALALAALAAALPAAASAGTLKSYACKTPTGQPAPLYGWADSNSMAYSGPYNSCSGEAGFGVYMGTEAAAPGHAWRVNQAGVWRFNAPAGLAITRVELRRSQIIGAPAPGNTDENGGHPFGWITSNEGSVLEWCITFNGCQELGNPTLGDHPTNDRSFNFNGAASFAIEAGCGGPYPEGWCRPAAVGAKRVDLRVMRAVVHLRDDTAPQLQSTPIGTIRGAGPRSGVETLSFAARDNETGIYRVIAKLGGTEVARTTPSTNGGLCVNIGAKPGDDYEFLHPQPCPAVAQVALNLDTRQVANAEHLLEVQIVDATGNATKVLEERITVANAGAVSGKITLDKRSRGTVKASHGAKRTLTGKLVDPATGAPLAGAPIAVSQRLRRSGAAWSAPTTIATGADGRFALPLQATASRLIRLTSGATTVTAKLGVAAKITAKATPSSVSRGGRFKLTGAVSLEGLSNGTVLAVESYFRGRWRTIDTVRTRKGGKWTWSHKLTRSSRGSLPFRVRLEPAGTVPATGGSSRKVSVRVR